MDWFVVVEWRFYTKHWSNEITIIVEMLQSFVAIYWKINIHGIYGKKKQFYTSILVTAHNRTVKW